MTHPEIKHREITTNQKNVILEKIVILSQASRSLIARGAVEVPAVGSYRHNRLLSLFVSFGSKPPSST
jgi:hypothetical protein